MTKSNDKMDAVFIANHTGNPALSAYAFWNRSSRIEREHQEATALWKQRGFHIQGAGRNWMPDPQDAEKKLQLKDGQLKDTDSLFVAPYEDSWLQFQVKPEKIVAHGFNQGDSFHQESVVATLVSHAYQVWGGTCAISGSPEFKLQMWTEAYRQGVSITNFSPPASVGAQIRSAVDRELEDAGYAAGEKFPPIYAGYGGFLNTSGGSLLQRSVEPGVMRQRMTADLLKYNPMG